MKPLAACFYYLCFIIYINLSEYRTIFPKCFFHENKKKISTSEITELQTTLDKRIKFPIIDEDFENPRLNLKFVTSFSVELVYSNLNVEIVELKSSILMRGNKTHAKAWSYTIPS